MVLDSKRAQALSASAVAFLIIAGQIAGKATRDALFLSNFDVTSLPVMLISASLVSLGAVLTVSELMRRIEPGKLIPYALGLSSVLLIAGWWLTSLNPQVAAVFIYVHVASFGSILISGFWSVVNERFDPRSGKKSISRIATGGTIGGLAGGLLAERFASGFGVNLMLPLLGAIHLLALVLLVLFVWTTSPVRSSRQAKWASSPYVSSFRILRSQPYLRSLAFLVLVSTAGAAVIHYVFLSQASEAYGGGAEYLRFFGIYYTAISLITVVLQGGLSRISLQRLGVVKTVGLLPAVLTGGALANVAFPGLAVATGSRGMEAVIRNSLYRSSYEVLFTPVAPSDKRATKSIIDVGFDRAGDILGGGLVKAALMLPAGVGHPVMLGCAAALGIAGLYLDHRLHLGYVKTLEHSLKSKALELDLDDVDDQVTRMTLMETIGGGEPVTTSRFALGKSVRREDARAGSDASSVTLDRDPLLLKLLDLRSGNERSVRRVLNDFEPEPVLISQLIDLLAWDKVADSIIRSLRERLPEISGQLSDALLDRGRDFAIRRRVPRILAADSTGRSVDGLLRGLEDDRFEVRYQCGRALVRIKTHNPDVEVPKERVLRAVELEVSVDRSVWQGRRLLDDLEEPDEDNLDVDRFVRERADRSLEHVFNLLSLILPPKPLRIAFRGLHTNDAALKGTALEYLETVLPERVREQLWPFLETPSGGSSRKRSREEILEDLMESNRSIEINLETLRRGR